MYTTADVLSAVEGYYVGSARRNLDRYRGEFGSEKPGSGHTCKYPAHEAALFLAFLDQPKSLHRSYNIPTWRQVLRGLELEYDYIVIDRLWMVLFTNNEPVFTVQDAPYTVIYRPSLINRLDESRQIRLYMSDKNSVYGDRTCV